MFLLYLVLSISIIFPAQTAAFSATITGQNGIPGIRAGIDETNVEVEAEGQVSIFTNYGESFPMSCSGENQTYICTHTFPVNTLPAGEHTLTLTQDQGNPTTIYPTFLVDATPPEIISYTLTPTIGGLDLNIVAEDDGLTPETCAGISSLSISTQSETIYNKDFPERPCELAETIFVPLSGISGDIIFFLSLTDSIGQSTTISTDSLKIDYKDPEFISMGVYLGNETVTKIAATPVIVPYVTVRVRLQEDNLTKLKGDLSQFNANPSLSYQYKDLEGDCTSAAGIVICDFSGIQLNPSSSTVEVPLEATDGSGNIKQTNMSITFTVVQDKGEIVYFNPLEEHCDGTDCYVKEGVNKFKISVQPGAGEIVSQFITMAVSEVSNIQTIRPSVCNSTAGGVVDCYAYVPVIVESSGTTGRIVFTNPTADATGNSLFGITESRVILDDESPWNTTKLNFSDSCAIAGEPSTFNVKVLENASSKVKIYADTINVTGTGYFENWCGETADKEFDCSLTLDNFVTYPVTEEITVIVEDLAGNQLKIPYNLTVCEAETIVAPETISRISTSTNQVIDRHIATQLPLRVYLPLTFSVQSGVSNEMQILDIEHDGCMDTIYRAISEDPYFIGEQTFLESQGTSTSRKGAILVVPIGEQAISEDSIEIKCNISIYERVGNVRYLNPEFQEVKVDVTANNLPIEIGAAIGQDLNKLEEEINNLEEEIVKREKWNGYLEFICGVADTLGRVNQAAAIIESAGYVISLVAEAWGSGDKVWKVFCNPMEQVIKLIKKFFPIGDAGSSPVSVVKMFIKTGCLIYRCGLCTVEGQMAAVSMTLSIGDALIGNDGVNSEGQSEDSDQTSQEFVEDRDAALDFIVDQNVADRDIQQAVVDNMVDEGPPNVADYPDNPTAYVDDTAIYYSDLANERQILADRNTEVRVAETTRSEYQQSPEYIRYVQGDNPNLLSAKDDFRNKFNDQGQSDNWIINPFENKQAAKDCLCLPGVIYALNKEKQLKCKKYNCIKQAAGAGLAVTECERSYDVSYCLYVDGAIYEKYSYFGAWWRGLVDTIIKDPIKSTRMVLCPKDYLPSFVGDFGFGSNVGAKKCDSLATGWRDVFCGLTGAYLHLREMDSLWSDPFGGMPTEPDGTDYCGEAGLT